MDFERVMHALVEGLEQRHVRYALMGGAAMNALGILRSTGDLDFLIHRDDVESFDALMASLGYTRYHHTDNLSQYRSDDVSWGHIDVIHAFRQIAVGMLERAISRPVFDERRQMKVLQPEDVIGLKVQAIANNPARWLRDEFDIEALMNAYRDRLDWPRVRQYYEAFDMTKEIQQLQEKYGRAA